MSAPTTRRGDDADERPTATVGAAPVGAEQPREHGQQGAEQERGDRRRSPPAPARRACGGRRRARRGRARRAPSRARCITSAAARSASSRRHPVGDVHLGQLGRLGGGVDAQLAPLDRELALDQLVLRRHADPLAGGHRDARRRWRRPARPGARSPESAPPPAKPRISDTFDTSPSDTPNTAARAAPPVTDRCWWWISASRHGLDVNHHREPGWVIGPTDPPTTPTRPASSPPGTRSSGPGSRSLPAAYEDPSAAAARGADADGRRRCRGADPRRPPARLPHAPSLAARTEAAWVALGFGRANVVAVRDLRPVREPSGLERANDLARRRRRRRGTRRHTGRARRRRRARRRGVGVPRRQPDLPPVPPDRDERRGPGTARRRAGERRPRRARRPPRRRRRGRPLRRPWPGFSALRARRGGVHRGDRGAAVESWRGRRRGARRRRGRRGPGTGGHRAACLHFASANATSTSFWTGIGFGPVMAHLRRRLDERIVTSRPPD